MIDHSPKKSGMNQRDESKEKAESKKNYFSPDAKKLSSCLALWSKVFLPKFRNTWDNHRADDTSVRRMTDQQNPENPIRGVSWPRGRRCPRWRRRVALTAKNPFRRSGFSLTFRVPGNDTEGSARRI